MLYAHAAAGGAADHARRRRAVHRSRLRPGAAAVRASSSRRCSTGYGLTELLVKAAPLILIARRPRSASAPTSGTSAPRASSPSARSPAAAWRWLLRPGTGCWMLPADVRRRRRWAAWPGRRSPRSCKTRFNVSEILTSLMLIYVATLLLSYLVHGPWKRPGGLQLPADAHVHRCRDPADPDRGHARCIIGVLLALAVAVGRLGAAGAHLSSASRSRSSARRRAAARYAGFGRKRHRLARRCCSAAAWPGSPACSRSPGPIGQLMPAVSPGYGFTAIIVAFLGRLHPLGILLGRAADGAVLHRRRERRRSTLGLPQRGRPACSRACCCSSCSPPTSWSATASASVAAAAPARSRAVHEPWTSLVPILLTDHQRRDAAAARRPRRAGGRSAPACSTSASRA